MSCDAGPGSATATPNTHCGSDSPWRGRTVATHGYDRTIGGTMSERRQQIHLAVHFPGVNHTTVCSDPSSGSQIDFSSFVTLAQTAERAKFDFFFLAEGLRLREHRGRIHELDVVGRPDTFTVLAALAAVTERIGLSGTINSTFNEPFEVARQFASLDHLSAGRAAWNVVTSWDAFTGENFRRGGFLAREDRYERAREFLATARELWDSWDEDAIVADAASGAFVSDAEQGVFAHHGTQFDIDGVFGVPRPPRPSRHAVRHRRGVRGAAPTTGASRHLPGRGLRCGTGIRRRVGGLHLLPACLGGRGSALLQGREGPTRPLRPVARRTQDPPGCDVLPRRPRPPPAGQRS